MWRGWSRQWGDGMMISQRTRTAAYNQPIHSRESKTVAYLPPFFCSRLYPISFCRSSTSTLSAPLPFKEPCSFLRRCSIVSLCESFIVKLVLRKASKTIFWRNISRIAKSERLLGIIELYNNLIPQTLKISLHKYKSVKKGMVFKKVCKRIHHFADLRNVLLTKVV